MIGSTGRGSAASVVRVVVRGAIVLVGGYGLALNLGVLEGRIDLLALTFYTILSNLYVFAYYVGDVVFLLRGRARSRTTWMPRFKGSVVIAILLTFLVYHLLLAPIYLDHAEYPFFAAANIIPHYIIGPAVLVDWLLLDRKGVFRAGDPLRWTAVPLAYLAFALARAPFIGPIYGDGDSRFPYPLLDYDRIGVPAVVLTVALITAGFVALGYVLFGIDRGLARVGADRAAATVAR